MRRSELITGLLRGSVSSGLLLIGMLLAGCRIFPKTHSVSSDSDWQHINLYNHRAPYPKLYVEIDAVEGQGPKPDELSALRIFLERHCDKPGGITIKLDDTVSRKAALGRTAESLAVEYLNGAPDEQSAFLYVLYYNAKLRGKGAPVENPSFSTFPHPIIYIDRAYRMFGNLYGRTFARAVLLHEAGHSLGLCATTHHHGTEGHCTDAKCIMYSSLSFNVRRALTLRNPWTNVTLCEECVGDLARHRATPPSPKLDFWYGYLRRREEGYQPFGLPGLAYVQFGDPLREPSSELLEMRKKAIADMARGEYTLWAYADSFEVTKHVPALSRLAKDQDHVMRRLAQNVFKSIATTAGSLNDDEASEALDVLTDDLIAAAAEFPEQQAELITLREELSAPPGYGANLTKERRDTAGN